MSKKNICSPARVIQSQCVALPKSISARSHTWPLANYPSNSWHSSLSTSLSLQISFSLSHTNTHSMQQMDVHQLISLHIYHFLVFSFLHHIDFTNYFKFAILSTYVTFLKKHSLDLLCELSPLLLSKPFEYFL